MPWLPESTHRGLMYQIELNFSPKLAGQAVRPLVPQVVEEVIQWSKSTQCPPGSVGGYNPGNETEMQMSDRNVLTKESLDIPSELKFFCNDTHVEVLGHFNGPLPTNAGL